MNKSQIQLLTLALEQSGFCPGRVEIKAPAVCFQSKEEIHFRIDVLSMDIILKRLVKIDISKLFAGDPTATKVQAI